MAILLAIESSGSIGSVALFENTELMGSLVIEEERAHSRLLAGTIDSLMKKYSITYPELNAIGVSEGPGSYTGLRIGATLAKGLCYSLGIPLIGINTLKLMSTGFPYTELICPMIDARRMEVYTALYTHNGETQLEPTPLILDKDSFEEELRNTRIDFVGDGALKASEIISSDNAYFHSEVNALASNMGGLLFDKFREVEFEDLHSFEPEYLKPFYTAKPKSV